MNLKGVKFVRFHDSSSVQSSPSGFNDKRSISIKNRVGSTIRKGWEIGSESIRILKKPLKSLSLTHRFANTSTEKSEKPRKRILHPQGRFLQKWNKIFVLACVIAVSIDPLFFYIPVVDANEKCLGLDKNMEIIACVLRSVVDALYVLRIVFQFRTGFIAPSSRVFGRGELVDDPKIIAVRYLKRYFIIDLLSVLPLPQVVVLIILPRLSGPVSLVAKNMLKFVIFNQYVPRLIRLHPLSKEVTSTSGILTETAWAGAVFNLLLYMLASHIFGAFWYLHSIERQDRCWRNACGRGDCNATFLYCGNHRTRNYSFVSEACPFIQPDEIKNSTTFNFGIFTDALDSGVVESKDFPRKFFYCFWWGLRNLSSLGQNLKTSTHVWEILFAISISIAGLVLFSLLIGNMQKYLQSTTVRIEEMRVKRRDAEQWMSHRMLPPNLRDRVRRYEQYKWQETRGVEERTLIRSLPKDVRRDINRHLSLDLLMRVPLFEKMDEKILDAVCDRLRPALYIKDSFIVREGDPVDEMLFIMRGKLLTVTTNGGRTGFFNAVHLEAGDFCGEGLLTWALDPQSSSNLPISTRTVQALTEVEAFALVAEDLKSVASQFRRLHHKDILHTFRFCSVQWRTWAACFIQAAWRRHCKRKQAKSLQEAEEKLQEVLANEAEASVSFGAAIYASRFAANALRNLRQTGARNMESATSPTNPRGPQRLTLLPQKPADPDFSSRH
ncbi:hypothetical protein K2173_003459 [Erythroxylum novogranatense]|uniref:Cyclic nucleotide-binding domain-containing protein n=1 Tax=Erythroxylum novogranatense TaxID=1862640 RepID=A0AAV8S8S6_9ROSI|nr:hypothetical protein K2173_003459 [Erythroxylum novogranatense]